MKIGILTHHYVKNYGAFLQMKAMHESLGSIYPGSQIEVIDYVVGTHWRKNILHVLHYRLGIDSLKTYFKKMKQLYVFTKYERSIPRTKRVYSHKDIEKLGLDLLVFGSDEIWNLQGSGYHPLKFGCGLEDAPIKMIAYAPSVGSVTEETIAPEELSTGLHKFERISGRDLETIRFVKRIANREALKMLDPTFLYDFDIDIEKENIQKKPFKYILIYDCKLTEPLVKELKDYANKHGYKILGAGDYKKYYDEVTINLTPYEWVSLFRNAEKVITGTFHGTVFSVKYDKDVICYPTEENRINKISSLLQDLKLHNCLLKVGKEEQFKALLNNNLDYTYVHEYIEKNKKEAMEFLNI